MVGIETATAIWQTLMMASTAFVVLLLASFVYLGGILPRLSAQEVVLPEEEPKDAREAVASVIALTIGRALMETVTWVVLTVTLLAILVLYLGGAILGLLGIVLAESSLVVGGVVFLLITLVAAVVFIGRGVYDVAKAVSETWGKRGEEGT